MARRELSRNVATERGEPAGALALASGMSVEESACKAGVSTRTLFRRLEERSYRRRISELRAEMIDRALGQLTAATIDATATLRALLQSDSQAARLGAARAILEHVGRLRDSIELEHRIAALEGREATA
jgi:hypothetical protein